jgi:hypothetical protein
VVKTSRFYGGNVRRDSLVAAIGHAQNYKSNNGLICHGAPSCNGQWVDDDRLRYMASTAQA